jgi:chorismate-pyruvate lyase
MPSSTSVRGPAPPRPMAADIDPFDRMLLSTDGTVTTLLATCTGEPIITRATRQAGPAPLDRLLTATGCWWHPDAKLLELSPADRVIARRATLRGGHSGVVYVLAESLVVPDHFASSRPPSADPPSHIRWVSSTPRKASS